MVVMRGVLVSAMTVVALAAGCSQTPDVPGSSGDQTPETFNAVANPAQVPVLLRKELGENVTVRRVSLLEHGFTAEVRDPQRKQNLDTYSYFYNRWDVEPVSVSQYDIDEMDKTTFGLGSVDWSVIPRLERRALDELDLEDEEVSVVSVDRIAGDPPRIFIAVNGSRGNGMLIANGRGGDVVVRRN
ncbi:MAG: hypothetical protein U0R64_10650 [Candidatus Nanopelagicales bacterium]